MKGEVLYNLHTKEKRLKTFKKWHFKEPSRCTKENLAEAGFYFIGSRKYPDVVKCFCCQKELDGWEESDDPWEEHRGHSSNCYFANLRKKDSELTHEDVRNIEMHRQLKAMDILLDAKIADFKNQAETTAETIRSIG